MHTLEAYPNVGLCYYIAVTAINLECGQYENTPSLTKIDILIFSQMAWKALCTFYYLLFGGFAETVQIIHSAGATSINCHMDIPTEQTADAQAAGPYLTQRAFFYHSYSFASPCHIYFLGQDTEGAFLLEDQSRMHAPRGPPPPSK